MNAKELVAYQRGFQAGQEAMARVVNQLLDRRPVASWDVEGARFVPGAFDVPIMDPSPAANTAPAAPEGEEGTP